MYVCMHQLIKYCHLVCGCSQWVRQTVLPTVNSRKVVKHPIENSRSDPNNYSKFDPCLAEHPSFTKCAVSLVNNNV